MRPAADGGKLFLWCEVSVLMDGSLLPEGTIKENPEGYLRAMSRLVGSHGNSGQIMRFGYGCSD